MNFSEDFIIHTDKICARDLSYVQLHEFETLVSVMQDRASRPKSGIKWMLIYHLECNASGTNLGKMWKGMQKAELERKRLTEETEEAYFLMDRGKMLCMEEEKLWYRLS